MEDIGERINEVKTKTSKMNPISALMDIAKSVCKISYIDLEDNIEFGSGFFIKLETSVSNRPLYCLMTNEHVISNPKNNQIEVSYNNQHENLLLKLDDGRFVRDYRYLNIDAIIIEIKPEEIHKNYFLFPYINYDGSYEQFKNQDIVIVQFPEGKDLNFSEGKIMDINKFLNEIIYNSSTIHGSSGSPIFIKNSRNVLGLHKQGNKTKTLNFGNFIKPIVDSVKLGSEYGKKIYNGNVYEGEFNSDIKDGYGKITYSNEEYYIGKWKDYKKHGKEGVLFKKNNKIKYIGDFAEDLYEGNGKLIEENGDYYIGQFTLGYKFGEGKIFNKNNELIYEGSFAYDEYSDFGKMIINKNTYYIGNFQSGKKEGKGLIYRNDAILFEGEFKDNNFVKGKKFLSNGHYYIGQFKNYKMEGKGVIFNKNNLKVYEGEFLNDQKSGNGILFFDGGYYEGQFKENEMDGKGLFRDYEGNIIIEGFFVKGQKEGKGTINTKEYTYIGEFKNDVFHGKGTLILENGEKYEGEFKNGLKDGKGKLTRDDEIYEGFFKNDEKHGEGIIYDRDKNDPIYKGNFANGVFEGKGKFKLYEDEDSDYYEGEFKEGKIHGEGIIYDKNHNIIYDGHFVDNEKEGDNEKQILEDGGYYLGQFKKGKYNGKGVIYDENDEIIYDGDFVNDKKEGFGILYTVYEGKECYYKGQFKNDKYNGKGEIYLIKGDQKVLEGNYINGKLNGKAKVYLEYGVIKEVEFKNDKTIGEAITYIKDNGILKLAENLNQIINDKEKCNIF